MGAISLEHSKSAYSADFAFYALAIVSIAVYLIVYSAGNEWATGASLMLAAAVGLSAWSLIEYLLHRFVLHGLQPFKRWHLEHHARPTALIAAPTVLSSSLIFTLVFLPAWALLGLQNAAALTLGVLVGYLTYAGVHHAVHHWRTTGAWLSKRKRWHALHHHAGSALAPGRYGVSTSLWDHIFSTMSASPRKREGGG
jgi:Fatty acid hydroxylase superfamily